MIEADLAYVHRMEGEFQKGLTPEIAEAMKYALVLEAIIHDQAELNEWLGPEVETYKASRYDDIKNGVDSIAEFQQGNGAAYLALALDVTYGRPSKKLRRIQEEIEHGRLTEIKYFRTGDGSFEGRLTNVPRVVVGTDREAITALAELWLQKKNRELASHPIQLQILDEISMQLKKFIQFAKEKGKNEIVDIYQRQLALIESIRTLPNKKALRSRPGGEDYKRKDRVYLRLVEDLHVFGR